MLLWVVSVKLVIEIALLALVGRWVLLAWLRRLAPTQVDGNVFLWVLDVLCRPVLAVVTWITPRGMAPTARQVVALAGLAGLWVAATLMKISLCVDAGVQACR